MMGFVRRWWWKALALAAVVLVAIQFVPYGVDHPAARDEPRWDSARTRTLFMAACGDCHSNQTRVLWFEQVAPVKWYVANHVEEGRAALNISEWHTAAGEHAEDAAEPIERGSMPPASYHYFGLHGDAKLTAAQDRQLIDGLNATIAADPPAGGEHGEHGEGDRD
jgi:hypothetical protein